MDDNAMKTFAQVISSMWLDELPVSIEIQSHQRLFQQFCKYNDKSITEVSEVCIKTWT